MLPPPALDDWMVGGIQPPTPTAGGTQDPYYVNSWGLADRWKLKRDPTLRRLVQRLWDAVVVSSPSSSSATGDRELPRQAYIELNVRLSKALLPKWKQEAAVRMAQNEWMVDSRAKTNEHPLLYTEFFDFIFDIVDRWCTTLDPNQYSDFLASLVKGVTATLSSNPDGTLLRTPPAVPPPSILQQQTQQQQQSSSTTSSGDEGEETTTTTEEEDEDNNNHHAAKEVSLVVPSGMPLSAEEQAEQQAAEQSAKQAEEESLLFGSVSVVLADLSEIYFCMESAWRSLKDSDGGVDLHKPWTPHSKQQRAMTPSSLQEDLPSPEGGTRPFSLGVRRSLRDLPVPHTLQHEQQSTTEGEDEEGKEDEGYDSDEEVAKMWRKPAHSIVIVGRPGTGMESVGRRIARQLEATYLDPNSLVQAAVEGDEVYGLGPAINEHLKSGKLLSNKTVARILDTIVHTNEVQNDGYVLTGFPEDKEQFEQLRTWQFVPTRVIVLDLPAVDAIATLQTLKADTSVGGKTLSSRPPWLAIRKQVPAPPAPPAGVSGDTNEDSDGAIDQQQQQDGGGDREERDPMHDGEQLEGAAQRPIKMIEVEEDDMVDETEYLPTAGGQQQSTTTTLVSPPEGTKEGAKCRVEQWEHETLPVIDGLISMVDEDHVLHVDGLQPIADQVQHIVQWLGSKECITVMAPQQLTEPPNTLTSPSERIKYLLELDTNEETGPRYIPAGWGLHDPVEFYNTHTVVRGNDTFTLAYCGRVFLFTTETNKEEFRVNPKKYLREAPPGLPRHLKICVIGPPLCGKSAQASLLSEALFLPKIEVGELISRHLDSDDDFGKQLKQVLLDGEEIPPVMYADMIAEEAARYVKLGTPEHRYGVANGWILDNFPNTSEQAAALAARGLCPDVTVVLRAEASSLMGIAETMGRHPDSALLPDRISEFGVEFAEVKESLLAAGSKLAAEISVTSMTPHEIHGNIMQGILPYCQIPLEIDEDLSTRPAIMRLNGDSGRFCPVTLKEQGCLVPGLGFNVRYKGHIYGFPTEIELDKFTANPQDFIDASHGPSALPPPKICMTGTTGSGRTKAALDIARAHRLVYVSFGKEIEDILASRGCDTGDSQLTEEEESKAAKNILQRIKSQQAESEGYVLDGYPRNEKDLAVLANEKQFPDVIVCMTCSVQMTSDRLRREPTHSEVQKFLQILKSDHQQQGGGGGGGETTEREGEGGNTTDTTTVSITAETTEEMLSNARRMAEEEAAERINKQHQMEMEGIDALIGDAKGRKVDLVEIDGTEPTALVSYHLTSALKPYLEDRGGLMSKTSCITITRDTALAFLRIGSKSLSKFGDLCPVHMHQLTQSGTSYMTPQTSIISDPSCDFPVLYRHCIYCTCCESCQQEFCRNPDKYVRQKIPFGCSVNNKIVVPKCAVLGGPLCGRSGIARHLQATMGITRLTLGRCLKRVVSSHSTLGNTIDSVLKCGLAVPQNLCVEAVVAAVHQAGPALHGYVLDGFPATVDNLTDLRKRGVNLDQFFYIKTVSPADDLFISRRAEVKRDKQHNNKGVSSDYTPGMLQERMGAFKSSTADSLIPYIQSVCSSLHVINASKDRSVWSMYEEIQRIITRAVICRYQHSQAVAHGEPAAVADLCLYHDRVEPCLGPCGHFCPVSLAKGELVCSAPRDYRFMAVYKGKYYHMAEEQRLHEFLEGNRYTHYAAQALPSPLPRRLPEDEAATITSDTLQMGGYCPVTFAQSGVDSGYEALVRGNTHYVVKYGGKYFAFVSEQKLAAFMRCPERYVRTVPVKVPPEPDPLPVSSLPLIGYIEQSIGAPLHTAMADLAEKRPVCPGLNTTESALRYLGLHLKVGNPKNSAVAKAQYQQAFDKLKANCSALVELLAKTNGQAVQQIMDDPQLTQLASQIDLAISTLSSL